MKTNSHKLVNKLKILFKYVFKSRGDDKKKYVFVYSDNENCIIRKFLLGDTNNFQKQIAECQTIVKHSRT